MVARGGNTREERVLVHGVHNRDSMREMTSAADDQSPDSRWLLAVDGRWGTWWKS